MSEPMDTTPATAPPAEAAPAPAPAAVPPAAEVTPAPAPPPTVPPTPAQDTTIEVPLTTQPPTPTPSSLQPPQAQSAAPAPAPAPAPSPAPAAAPARSAAPAAPPTPAPAAQQQHQSPAQPHAAPSMPTPLNKAVANAANGSKPGSANSTPSPGSSAAAAQTGSAGQSAAFRPLNVRDALQYLDRVKQQFASEYDVYDQFLNIMKDFKTQNIDTPGVIDRVSSLFRGHPALIQGFNTFLPPGYRIECHVSQGSVGKDGREVKTVITVTTPMGVTTRTQDVGGTEASEFVKSQPAQQQPAQSTSAAATTAPSAPPPAPAASSSRPRISPPAPIPPYNPNKTPFWQAGQQQQQQTTAPPKQPTPARPSPIPPIPPHKKTASPAPPAAPAASSARPPSAGPSQDKARPGQPSHDERQPTPAPAAANDAGGGNGPPQVMEFNHAINYVNKIKNRFIKDPDTYKTFLEILQTYQKETRPIQEVYAQVTTLFHSAPDLLDEFKAFLPDTSAEGGPAQGGAYSQGGPGQQQPQKKAAQAAKAATTAAAKKLDEKKKRAAPGMSERAKAKRAKTGHAADGHDSPPPEPSHARPPRNGAASASVEPLAPQGPYHPDPYGAVPAGFPGAPRMQSAYDAYLSHHRTPALVVADEFAFFERVKRHVDDKLVYNEFLKLLNLFTQEIIDISTLLEKALLFIGSSDELMQAFKDLVGWDPVKDGRIPGEDWIIDNEPALERPLVHLLHMKPYGPSYRQLPDCEVDLACSGRDALEWSVLNDHWVAQATWGSEGSSAHRKNIYEEALYNSEQERHWYSFHIESLARTINHFEPIAARIQLMNAEDRLAFRLEDGLGGGSAPSVYERMIRKVYGKDHGWEIINALIDNPAVAVPIVLGRLKQKDEEWKRAEKEWNKVWREVDAKNFYKALDHASIPFKAADKKQTTTSKSLTNECDALKRDKQQKRQDVDLAQPSLRPLHQFELGMADREMVFDVLKLCLSFLDRDQSGFSGPERVRLERFLRMFIPLLFNIDQTEMEANIGKSDETDMSDSDDEQDESAVAEAAVTDAAAAAEPAAEGEDLTTTIEEDSSSANDTPVNGDANAVNGSKKAVNRKGGAADLRKRLLTAANSKRGGKPSRSRANSPESETSSSSPGTSLLAETTWIRLVDDNEETVDPLAGEEGPRRFNFFANSPFYCMIRIFHTVYHRLAEFKSLARLLAAQPKHQRLNPMAVELGLATPMSVIDDLEHNPADQYYPHLLELAEKLFDGDIDQATYEEQLRYMAGIKAYPLFTLDKLISAVIKHVHTANSDSKCQDIVDLLEKDRARQSTTPRQQIAYRMEAEAAIGVDDALYRIEWIPEAQTVTIQLLGKEDLTLDDAHESERKLHASWVASYALPSPTEGVGKQVKAPLLKRNKALAQAEDHQNDFDLVQALEARVTGDSYQLLFVAGTEDYLFRKRPAEEQPAATEPEPEKPAEEAAQAEPAAPAEGEAKAEEPAEALKAEGEPATAAAEEPKLEGADEEKAADEPAAEPEPEAEAETAAEEEEDEDEKAVKETLEEVKAKRKARFEAWLEGAADRAREEDLGDEEEEEVGGAMGVVDDEAPMEL